MLVMIVSKDKNKFQENSIKYKENDWNIWKGRIIDGRKLRINLLKENKDNTVKLTRKWWDKKEQLILTGKEVIYF